MRYTEMKDKIKNLAPNRAVELVCVSKYHTEQEILEVYNLGQRVFGENKVQDLLKKREALPKDIKWHLLGHLQTNKVKQIVGCVELIHSLDSIKLANEIQKHSEAKGIVTNCLVQVNSTGIDDRFGVPYAELDAFIDEVKKLPNINLCGMMGMAPLGEEPAPYFKKLKEAFDASVLKEGILSMGMSGDFEEAIENGSTMVRLGRIIFE
ncbi:MAG: YggS family pyridoxal phosphate-dependent enzyme [Clostridia bacterium]|nr:YggS family pyridoxal phosphate-dependent enzyme [Clostridia bacterium]